MLIALFLTVFFFFFQFGGKPVTSQEVRRTWLYPALCIHGPQCPCAHAPFPAPSPLSTHITMSQSCLGEDAVFTLLWPDRASRRWAVECTTAAPPSWPPLFWGSWLLFFFYLVSYRPVSKIISRFLPNCLSFHFFPKKEVPGNFLPCLSGPCTTERLPGLCHPVLTSRFLDPPTSFFLVGFLVFLMQDMH